MMPCKHCESTDADNLIQELDYMEDPDGCELAFDVFYGKKALAKLQLQTADFNMLLARLARKR